MDRSDLEHELSSLYEYLEYIDDMLNDSNKAFNNVNIDGTVLSKPECPFDIAFLIVKGSPN